MCRNTMCLNLQTIKEAYEKADIVVFLVAHSVFKSLPHNDRKVILDFLRNL